MDRVVDAACVQLLSAALWDRVAVVEVNRFRLTDFGNYSNVAALLAWHDAAHPGAPSHDSERVSAITSTRDQIIALDRLGREYVRANGNDAVLASGYAHYDIPLMLRGMGSDIARGKFLDVVSPPAWADVCPVKHASAALGAFIGERDRIEAEQTHKRQLVEARAAMRLDNLQNQVADQFFAQMQPPIGLNF